MTLLGDHYRVGKLLQSKEKSLQSNTRITDDACQTHVYVCVYACVHTRIHIHIQKEGRE